MIELLPPSLRENLLEPEVYTFLMDEIAVIPYSEDELVALLAWSSHDQPDKPDPLFMSRLRFQANLPKLYRQPPCPYCGFYGGEHDSEYRGRYLSGPYAEFVEH